MKTSWWILLIFLWISVSHAWHLHLIKCLPASSWLQESSKTAQMVDSGWVYKQCKHTHTPPHSGVYKIRGFQGINDFSVFPWHSRVVSQKLKWPEDREKESEQDCRSRWGRKREETKTEGDGKREQIYEVSGEKRRGMEGVLLLLLPVAATNASQMSVDLLDSVKG